MANDQLTRNEETFDEIVAEIRNYLKECKEGHVVTQAAIARSTETVVAHTDRKIEPIERAVRALFGSRS
jgi:predicted component of type VI protein secretion system